MSSSIKSWISAFRLRTLPLSFSCILTAAFLAASHHKFDGIVLTLCLLTTLFLQVLSNLANDYGDAISGADNAQRVGPKRMVQSGNITKEQMKKAIVIAAILAFLSGIGLVYYVFRENWKILLLFILLGVGAIAAAIKYTVGKNPYGYSGLGDVFVFLFFGIVGVMGSYYLFSMEWYWGLMLPAISIGLFTTGVLNLNNMRDIENDAQSGKNTLVVKLGSQKAKIYHSFLILVGIISASLYTYLYFNSYYQLLFLLTLPLFIIHLKKVLNTKEPRLLDPELKKLALTTFAFSILFGVGLVIG